MDYYWQSFQLDKLIEDCNQSSLDFGSESCKLPSPRQLGKPNSKHEKTNMFLDV